MAQRDRSGDEAAVGAVLMKLAAAFRGLERLAAGKPVGLPQASIRFVGDDVAVVEIYMDACDEQTLASPRAR